MICHKCNGCGYCDNSNGFIGFAFECDVCHGAGVIPDTYCQWVSCRERLPDEIGRYWCYVEEQNSLGKSHYQWNCSWNDGWHDDSLTGRVTHWMPLATPPKS